MNRPQLTDCGQGFIVLITKVERKYDKMAGNWDWHNIR